jgi:ankyrin repeat protein
MLFRRFHLTWPCLSLLFFMARSQPLTANPPAADTNWFRAISAAVRAGHDEQLASLLEKKGELNACATDYSPLMEAALNGTVNAMKMLMEHGAKPNYQNARGITALWLAVPDMEKTQLLLDHGADPKILSSDSLSVLVKLANMPGTLPLFKVLVAHGADVHNASPGNFLLYNAASSCDTALLGYLLRSGLSPNKTTKGGDSPLLSALNYRCYSTAKMLVDYGADVNSTIQGNTLARFIGISALMTAAVSNDSLSFNYLLAHGANVNQLSAMGYSTLMFLQLAEYDAPELTQALINRGANVNQRSKDGETALSLARTKGNSQSLAILTKYQQNHP